jgi:hypothetical protein
LVRSFKAGPSALKRLLKMMAMLEWA